MLSIFHEQQEGALCAQHCLNALLQGPYFTAVDLAGIAAELDEEELRQYATESEGVDSPEYVRNLAQGSSNMDDSGFFSIQVLARALQVWSLELIPYKSSDSIASFIRRDPARNGHAFICHYRHHWFTIRRFANGQWFNLNSVHSRPHLITDTYLVLYIDQLLREGYSIFIIVGQLPPCTADDELMQHPIPVNAYTTGTENSSPPATPAVSNNDWQLKAAISMSLQDDDNNPAYHEALKQSLLEHQKPITATLPADHSLELPDDDEMAKAIALSLQSPNEMHENVVSEQNGSPSGLKKMEQ